MTIKRIASGVLALILCATPALAQSKTINIAMAKSFFIDKSKNVADIAAEDFKKVLKKATDLDGVLNTKLTAFEMGAKLDSKELQFGLFFAHELGWVMQKYPDVQPLLIAVNRGVSDSVHIIVHKKSPAKSLADLAGKKIDIPAGTIEPSRLYLERMCLKTAGKPAAMFFGKIEQSTAQAAAMDAVARGLVDATVLETSALEFYKEVKGPVYNNNLRVLQESGVFPSAAIAYKKGGVDEATLKRFRDGLAKVHTIPEGRNLMKEWRIDVLELATPEYAKSLADLIKIYPAP